MPKMLEVSPRSLASSYLSRADSFPQPPGRAERGSARLAALNSEVESIEEAITAKEAELLEATPAWEDKSRELSAARESLEAATTTLGTLRAKQGRRNQFKTQKERDAHLRQMVSSHASMIDERRASEKTNERALKAAKEELEEGVKKHAELRKEFEGRKESQIEMQDQLSKLREQHRAKAEQRK